MTEAFGEERLSKSEDEIRYSVLGHHLEDQILVQLKYKSSSAMDIKSLCLCGTVSPRHIV
jgi:hypothetical protein